VENEDVTRDSITSGQASTEEPTQSGQSACDGGAPSCKNLIGKKSTKKVSQKFSEKWLEEHRLTCFEEYQQDKYFAYCKICLVKINIANMGKQSLYRHLESASHVEKAEQVKTLATCPIEKSMTMMTLTDKIKESELKLVC
jgi:hypothetical protein